MTRDELMAKRRAAATFCAEHIAECAKELIEWQDTAILRAGRMRELAALCTEYMGNHDGLRGAERMIERRACEIVADAASKGAAAAEAPRQWIKTAEQLPVLPKNAPSYSMNVRVLGCFGDMVAPLLYARNMYAKTEKGRAPRWERWDGSLSATPDAWMLLPAPPPQQQSAQREKGGDGESR